MSDQDQLKQSVASILVGTPRYVANYVIGFLLAIISDIPTTSLAGGSACVGYATNSPWIGLAIFLLTHVTIKMTNAISTAIVKQGQLIANAGHRLAYAFESSTANPGPSGTKIIEE